MAENNPKSPSKKRKAHANHVSPSSKKIKCSPRTDTSSEGEFHVINSSLTLSVPPVFTNNPRAGVQELLDSMVMRYIPAFRGVVLSHSNLSFMDKRATIKGECPFLVCDIIFDALVWCPKIGMKLNGRVNLCSPDHISLLIHRTFNASIPRHHIPLDDWEFHHGPAESDPEFGPEAAGNEEPEEKPEDEEQESGGRWINRHTGAKVGGEHGYLEFTIIGLTVANEMLSLQGSIQVDPFSPKHVAQMNVIRHAEPAETDTEDADAIERQLEEDLDGGSDTDTFKLLGQETSQAVTPDKQKRQPENGQSQSEGPKKKRRKEQGEGKNKNKRKKAQ